MRAWASGSAGYRSVPSAADVLEQLQAAVVVTDEAGHLLYANAYAVSLFGLPDYVTSMVGRSLVAIGFEPEDARRLSDLAAHAGTGKSWEGTFAIRQVDGSRVFVRARAFPLRLPSGDISGIAILAREVTTRGSRRERDRLRLLERIGERLAQSLELGVTLRQVAENLVPQFADHCFVDLFQGDKLIRRAQLNSRGWVPEPGTWAMVGEPVRYPEGHFAQQAMTSRDTIVITDMAGQHFPPPREGSLKARAAAGLTSAIATPLIARGELLGVMSLALSGLTDREEKHFAADDGDFLGAIGSRVAVAIDNAMLFEEERRTALAFQTSLLPRDPPHVDGLEVAYKYVPARPLETHGQGIQTQVGGDWYDIIPLSFANAGHDAPLLITGDEVGQMEIEHKGLLLGVRSKGMPGLPTYREETRYLAPGSALVFYTDGLTDRRQRADGGGHYSEAEALQMLREAVQKVTEGSVEAIAGAAEQAVPGEIDDDMAIVVVRTSAVDLAFAERNFPADPIRVSEARRLAYQTFVSWDMDPEQADLACLLVSEVVTNVVLHAAVSPSPRHEFSLDSALSLGPGILDDDWSGSPFADDVAAPLSREFTLRLRRGASAVWVEVFDPDLRLPRIRTAGENDEGGRGLYLVDQLATRWGSRPTHDGKAVWFEIPIKAGSDLV
jgi:PAS domain S-box-containing protein